MKVIWRRRFLTTLLAAAGFAAGCGDLGSFLYFIMPEQKYPAEIKGLAADDKKKPEVKAMILVRNGSEMNFNFPDADRRLASLLHDQLETLCKANDEFLTILLPAKVEAFKSSHPRWDRLDPAEIGRFHKVDYVIYIEIKDMSLYERNDPMFYRGRADLSVKLVDVKHPDESPARVDKAYKYPTDSLPIQIDDEQAGVVRDKFLADVAKRLSWCFAPHPVQDAHKMDGMN